MSVSNDSSATSTPPKLIPQHQLFPLHHINSQQKEFVKHERILVMYQGAVLFEVIQPDATRENESSTNIYRTIRYLPLEQVSVLPGRLQEIPSTAVSWRPHHSIKKHVEEAVRIRKYAVCATWPLGTTSGSIPAEIFHDICDYLHPRDIRSMRLVDKEFDKKVSPYLLRSSVVPFNNPIYDVLSNKSVPGGVEKTQHDDPDKVFETFGAHIRRFGMSFEVSEESIKQAPQKPEYESRESYYGTYDWVPKHYLRYPALAHLEQKADEASRMKKAFAALTRTHELALCLDSGLGWLKGPDSGFLSSLLSTPQPIIRSRAEVLASSPVEQQIELARALCDSAQGKQSERMSLGNYGVASLAIDKTALDMEGIAGTMLQDTSLWPTAQIRASLIQDPTSQKLHVMRLAPKKKCIDEMHIEKPNDLRRSEREWLLEAGWAQCAFLESYMVAIIDNPTTFSKVNTLNISKLSSGMIPQLERESFWNALPSVTRVGLMVEADWRFVHREGTCDAELYSCQPSDAVVKFVKLVKLRLQASQTIKKLQLGYTSGGEHAVGCFAKYQHILPAPLCTLHKSALRKPGTLTFPALEELTLVNCWMTPTALIELVHNHRDLPLRRLCLDSFSLTADPTVPVDTEQAIPTLALSQEGMTAFKGENVWWSLENSDDDDDETDDDMDDHQTYLRRTAVPRLLAQLGVPNSINTSHIFTSRVRQASSMAWTSAQPQRNGRIRTAANSKDSKIAFRTGCWPIVLSQICPDGRTELFEWTNGLQSADEDPTPQLCSLAILDLKSVGYVKLSLDRFSQKALTELNCISRGSLEQESDKPSGMMTTTEEYFGTAAFSNNRKEEKFCAKVFKLVIGKKQGKKFESNEDVEHMLREINGEYVGETRRMSGKLVKQVPE